MSTPSELQARLTAIRRAIATGVRTVQFAGRSVTYNSPEELRQVEREIVAQLANRPKQTLLVATKGL